MPGLHHHQNSLSHYPSPPPNGIVNGQHVGVGQGSPGSAASQIITPHWQQQLLKCEMIRASRQPHHRARASAMASRTVAKSAIAITNPNKPASEPMKEPETPPIANASANGTESSPKASGPADSHPSSTSAPIEVAPRRTAAKPPANTWSSLDMGGVQIKNLPPTSGLFSFTFLVNLYLNHNALSTVPPEISKLRHLELLDLSGNNLVTVPTELGMLTSLKELYLFDNHISTIPPELGTLHQLQTIGVEGNPLEPSLKALVQKEGTPALIAFLRDSCPIPPSPPDRMWRDLLSPAEREALLADQQAETFTVVCYNILAEKYATERLYGYTPSWALAWEYRKGLILREVLDHDADFLCLQEVDTGAFEEYFSKRLGERGYDGVHVPKSRHKTMSDADRRMVDGCAIFYKRDKYTMVENFPLEFGSMAMQRADFKKTDDMFNRVLNKDHVAVVCLFENKETRTRFVIANAHIIWDPAFRDVKLVQTAMLMDEVEKHASQFVKYPPAPPTPVDPNAPPDAPPPRVIPTYTDAKQIPLIVAGDYNSVPEEAVYDFMANGYCPPDHADFMSHQYGRYTSEGIRHRFGLKSAYAGAGELPLTNFTPSYQGAIDYIWYSTGTLTPVGVLGEVDKGYLKNAVGFPDPHHPSDHISILAEFRVKPPREAAPARPPPVFPGSSR
ncbi:hypothetical protein FA95DRAFT_1488266 [Auriscalpium vulgare]|uniref:Uncharacterized protein n=1 Tax=Auriscalpium vulgare TaxID=40419 RepID=A0ACB8S190_9AGAM|nr:hypothetical protein FA95DRAFT_1488266 [Auriscalpium vulgare]